MIGPRFFHIDGVLGSAAFHDRILDIDFSNGIAALTAAPLSSKSGGPEIFRADA